MLHPVVERELRVALLRREARKQWMSAAWTAGGITFIFMLVLQVGSGRTSGRTLFFWLFALACAGIVRRGFGLTADLFSEERRNGTLGLIVLTGLTPLEIFTTKLLGAVLLAAFALLGALPFFAIPFLAGGVLPIQFLCALVFLANGLLFCVAIGLFASVLHRDGGQAQFTALLVTAGLCVFTPLVHWAAAASGTSVVNPTWLTLSPAYAPYLVFKGLAAGSLSLFWAGSGVTLGYSIIALSLAAGILHRTWRDGPESLLPRWWTEWWTNRVRGHENWRWRLRWRLLDTNPFCWLAARDRRPVVLAWVFLGVTVVLWLAGWALWGRKWLSVGPAFASSVVLHQGLNAILAYAAGRRLGEERQTGGLEMLLSTPLIVEEIVDGQRRALTVQFVGVFVATFALDVLFCCCGYDTRRWEYPAPVTYPAVWLLWLTVCFAAHLATAFRAMWISVWTGRPGYAAMQAAFPALWPFAWIAVFGGAFITRIGEPGAFFLPAIIFIVMALTSFNTVQTLRNKLNDELRRIACAPIPARNDKRFKGWKPGRIYPPGSWGELKLKPAMPGKSRGRQR